MPMPSEGVGKPSHELLRKCLPEESTQQHTMKARGQGTIETNGCPTHPSTSSPSFMSISRGSGGACATGNNCQAEIIDIWHPDFWHSELDSVLASGASSLAGARSRCRSLSAQSIERERKYQGSASVTRLDKRSLSLGKGGVEPKKKNTFLIDVLTELRELDIDAEGDDDASQVSDISGTSSIGWDVISHGHNLQKREKFSSPPQAQSESIAKMPRRSSFANRLGSKKEPSYSRDERLSRTVSFGIVNVRYYERILSDHPGCSGGPSIGLGWEFDAQSVESCSVSEWELARATTRKPTKRQLIVTRKRREKLLQGLGYTSSEIADMVRLIVKVKHQRKQTITSMGIARVEEALETARKRAKKLVSLPDKQTKRAIKFTPPANSLTGSFSHKFQ